MMELRNNRQVVKFAHDDELLRAFVKLCLHR